MTSSNNGASGQKAGSMSVIPDLTVTSTVVAGLSAVAWERRMVGAAGILSSRFYVMVTFSATVFSGLKISAAQHLHISQPICTVVAVLFATAFTVMLGFMVKNRIPPPLKCVGGSFFERIPFEMFAFWLCTVALLVFPAEPYGFLLAMALQFSTLFFAPIMLFRVSRSELAKDPDRDALRLLERRMDAWFRQRDLLRQKHLQVKYGQVTGEVLVATEKAIRVFSETDTPPLQNTLNYFSERLEMFPLGFETSAGSFARGDLFVTDTARQAAEGMHREHIAVAGQDVLLLEAARESSPPKTADDSQSILGEK